MPATDGKRLYVFCGKSGVFRFDMDGKLNYVSQNNGTFVVAAQPTFEMLAHNEFEEVDSRTNASPEAELPESALPRLEPGNELFIL